MERLTTPEGQSLTCYGRVDLRLADPPTVTVGPFLSHAQGGSSRLRTAYALINMTMHVGGALVRMSASPVPKGEEII